LGKGEELVMLGPGVTVSVSGRLLVDVLVLSVTFRTTWVEVVASGARGPEIIPVLGFTPRP
jgi:hypothetical protein